MAHHGRNENKNASVAAAGDRGLALVA
jgi:hypothetical protein